MRITSPALFTVLLAAPLLMAQEPAAKLDTAAILQQALTNMAKVSSYHVEAEITTPAGKAKLEGDLGVGTVSLKGKDAKGNQRVRIVADKTFFLSLDGGATWKTGDEADKPGTIMLSQLITAPVDPSLKIWEKDVFTAQEEKFNNEDLLHLEKPAAGKESGVHFWLVREPDLDNAIFVRKISMTISADDGDFPVVVTYTKLNKPVDIKAPAGK